MAAKVLEQLIARGRRERKPAEQREVSFNLAEISTNPEFHVKMVEKGVVRSLLHLITDSSDDQALRFACLCLGNTSSCASIRLRIVEEGVLPPLIELMKKEGGDILGKQYSAMTVGNLAAEPENHEEIVKLHAIAALVNLVDPEEPALGAYAAFALANLAVNNEYRPLIVEQGAIPRLIACTLSLIPAF
ncbi:unnamed protein product [Aphanomyces euteiches]